MNESDLDKICDICEEGYDKAIEFAEEECLPQDDQSFEAMFEARLRITLIKIKEVMVERMKIEKEMI